MVKKLIDIMSNSNVRNILTQIASEYPLVYETGCYADGCRCDFCYETKGIEYSYHNRISYKDFKEFPHADDCAYKMTIDEITRHPEILNTCEGIVEDLYRNFEGDPDDQNDFADMPESDLIKLHSSFGRHIRNHYKLWDNPEIHQNYQLITKDNNVETDSISQYIIEQLHKKFNKRKK